MADLNREYRTETLKSAYTKAKSMDRKSLLQKCSRPSRKGQVYFSSQYSTMCNEIRNIIKKNWDIIQSDPQLRTVIPDPPVFCFRRAPTLKDQLVGSYLPPSHSSWLQRPVGTFSCGSCNHCSHIDRSTSFKDPSGKLYQLKGYANCNTTFVVYKLECDCGCFYIGRTKRRLKDRLLEHKRAIRNHDQQYPMAMYFQTAGHNINTLRVMVIETIPKSWRGGDRLKQLLQRETFWIVTLNATMFPGLNDEIDFAPFL